MAVDREALIRKIEELPGQLESVLRGVGDKELDTRYREGGWTARQVVHHLADSHMNAFIRTRLIVTEQHPTLKPYDQDAWALLEDSKAPVGISLDLLRGLHARWAVFLRSLPEEAWSRSGVHPEIGEVTMDQILASYAAHGERHLGHVRLALERASQA